MTDIINDITNTEDTSNINNEHIEESETSQVNNDSNETFFEEISDVLEEENHDSLDMIEELLTEEVKPILPENSDEILVSQNTSRFNSALWYSEIQLKTILLAGLGGIGSYVAFLLGRVQPARLIMYDDDIVDYTNLSGQLYDINHVSQSKTNAITSLLSNFCSYNSVVALKLRYTRDHATEDIMICGFDNMESRRVFFHAWVDHVKSKTNIEDKKKCLFIDGRIKCLITCLYK